MWETASTSEVVMYQRQHIVVIRIPAFEYDVKKSYPRNRPWGPENSEIYKILLTKPEEKYRLRVIGIDGQLVFNWL
jgi:hypothetical protein